MHELGIVQGTLDLAVKTAKQSGAQTIHLVRMRVGALSGVVTDALIFAFETLRSGTLADQARLEVETVPATFWCAPCRKEFAAEDFIGECPQCHELSSELRRGRELELTSMEVS